MKRIGDVIEGAGDKIREDLSERTDQIVTTIERSSRGVAVTRLSDTFANFDLRRNPGMKWAMDQVKAVAEGKAWCAFLCGGFGTGKTHLAIAALLDWYEREKTGYFWKVPDWLAWIKHMCFDLHWPEGEILQPYREGGGLVVFDDLGTENPTDWSYQQLYRVLDNRYELKVPTIVTTNTPAKNLDGRLVSRFRSGFVVCEGEDQR